MNIQTTLTDFHIRPGRKISFRRKETLETCSFNYGKHTLTFGENRDEVGNRYAWAHYCTMCGIVLRSSDSKQVGTFIKW